MAAMYSGLAGLAILSLLCSAADAGSSHAKQVDTIFAAYTGDVPGASVMVIRDGAVLYKKAFGLANLEERTPATTATNYRLASVTKQFTAMAIMILSDRKLLSYDDSLAKFFPDFPPYGKQITIRRLLTHTSGMLAYEDLIPQGTILPLKDRDVLNLLAGQGHTYFAPGAEYRYSNSGYAHLALIVEAVSGMPFAQFLRKNIFEPLNMNASVAYEQGISTVARRAFGYTATGKSFEATDQSITSSVLGDGGIYSSVEDLYKWDQALYGEKLVCAGSLEQAFTPERLNDGRATGYGFGWEIGKYRELRTVRHSGHTVGFSTAIARFPEQRFTVIVLVNRSEIDTLQLADQIADMYLF
jgi:CubicO group peptidase (beta-lactamase class C family)